jgi:transcriptional regulator with XRE-family HTH domain
MAGRPSSADRQDAGARLGLVLRRQREQAGMTRAELASRATVAMNTVMAIEQGRVADPGFFTVAALGRGLQIGTDEVLNRVQEGRGLATRRTGGVMSRGLVSIGYEGRDVTELVNDLRLRGVDVVADVRLNAISRRRGFSKRALAEALEGAGIEYRHLRDLGNPKENRAGFQEPGDSADRESFRGRLRDAAAQAQLTELTELATRHVVAVFCVERDEQHCHRQIVIDAVRMRDITVPAVAAG